MAQVRGVKAQLSCASESTFKTLGTLNPQVIPIVSESIKASRDLVSSAIIRGNRNPYQPVLGQKEISGDITTYLSPYLGKLFYHLLGGKASTGTTIPYTHTLTVSDLPTGLTIQKAFSDVGQYFVYKGCKINSMKITARPTGFVETTFSIMGADMALYTSSQITAPTDYTQSNVGGSFTGYTISLNEGGSSLGIGTEVDLTIENNLDGSVFVINGTGTRYSIPEGLVKVSGTLRALFESETLLNKAINGTESSLALTFQHGTGDGTANNEKLIITVDELIYKPQDPVISGPAGIMLELAFEGYFQNGSSSSAVSFTLVNTQTGNDLL